MTNEPTDKELIDWAIENKRVDILVEHKWGYILSPGQVEIVRKIAFLEHKRLSVSAMTRYGKTQCVALGIALLLDFGVPAKIAFIGPKQEQAGILRQYLADLILADKSLLSKAQIYATGEERIGKEASRKRMTFTTGAEYRVFSAEGEADRLMGFGCVSPEAEIITHEGVKTAEQIWKTSKRLMIYSYNHKSKKCEFQRIKHRINNHPRRDLIKIHHEKGCFVVTDNHPIYVKGKGYIEAISVRSNDKLLKCNCFPNQYGNNTMQSMRKHNNPQIEPYSKSKEALLQSQVQRRMAKRKEQLYVGWWGKASNLRRMWQRILYRKKFIKDKDLLQCQMQRYSNKEKTKSKGKIDLRDLWQRIRSDTSKKGISILFKKMCQQRSCGKDVDGKEPSMARRNQKSTMGSRFQQEIKKPDKRKRWSQVFFMWKDWILTDTSYRLRQEKQQRRESCNFMSQLPLQDKLQERDVEEVIVTRIEKVPAGNETYNFEVEKNNNYFVDGILTHNCDVCVKDEACLISRTANAKIMRMLGDNPEEAVLIELYNPWDRDNVAFEHTMDPEFKVIQIGWKQAVKEGRTTEKFVMQQKRDLTPLEFTVLYESLFPEQGEDSLFSLDWIKEAETRKYNFQNMLQKTREDMAKLKKQRNQISENEYKIKLKPLEEELAKYTLIVSCDPAEQGLDETVIMWGIEYENKYQVIGTYSEGKSDPIDIAGKIDDIANSFIPNDVRGKINIDRIGIGSGTLSWLKKKINIERELKNIKVLGCHYGERAMKKDIFHNKKAENWFRLADIMREGMIDIPENHKLRSQLVAEKWERTSANRKIVKDPEDKSPDWGDGLVYLCWKDKSALAYGFA